MSESALAQTKLIEYRQRRAIEKLRQQLYTQPDPSASPQLTDALMNAEVELLRLEQQRSELECETDQGVLWQTRAAQSDGAMMGAETTGVDARITLRLARVPTGIVHLLNKDETPLVTYEIGYTGDQYVRLRLTSFVEGYSAQSIDTLELLPRQSATVNHLPTFFPDRLQAVTELTRATLHVCIDDLDGRTEQHTTFPIELLARTSAYNGVQDPATGNWIDLSPYFGAWVTPNAEGVMRLLRRAAELHPQSMIAGYQVDATGVEEQVKAIFNALKEVGMVYVNSVLAFGAAQGEYLQRVRLPREALASKSANCIDGTVLMASALEAASLNPGIVLVPGHAYLAWEMQDGSGMWDFLETTMIGTYEFEEAVLSARTLSAKQKSLAERMGDPRQFQLLPLIDLRVRRGITPME